MNHDTFIYFIKPVGMDGPVKIGWSVNPMSRVSEFMTYSPFPLELVFSMPGTRELDWNLHDCFFDLHSHREWFFADERLTSFIQKLIDGMPLADAIDLTDRRGSVRSKIATKRWQKRRAQ